MKALRILIADDSNAVRRALKGLLSRNPADWVLCGEAINGEDALKQMTESHPDVVLLDLSLPLLPGLKVAEILQREYPECRLILMSEQEPEMLAQLAALAGTPYCIPKMRLTIDLLPMLQTLAGASVD
jgi:DNA-binding NarL/FixJ family response regulator